MRVKSLLKAYCVGKNEKKSLDGKSTYYNCGVSQDGEAGTLSCTEEVYGVLENFKEYEFVVEYSDGQYKNLRILSVVPLKIPQATPIK